jgi:hypothetical protein
MNFSCFVLWCTTPAAAALRPDGASAQSPVSASPSCRDFAAIPSRPIGEGPGAPGAGPTGPGSRPLQGPDRTKRSARAALATSQCRREQGALAGRVDSPALELICLKYVGGQPLEERLAVLGPEALAKTFAAVLNAISKDAATRSLSPFTKT